MFPINAASPDNNPLHYLPAHTLARSGRLRTGHSGGWAKAMETFGRLAGFHDKVEVDTNVAGTVLQMSDAELIDKLAELQDELAH